MGRDKADASLLAAISADAQHAIAASGELPIAGFGLHDVAAGGALLRQFERCVLPSAPQRGEQLLWSA